MDTRTLIFATGNPHKISEVQMIAGNRVYIASPADVGFPYPDLPETASSLDGNAIQKACALYDRLQRDCFAEDTGLEVNALQGAPGINTARYAGPGYTPQQNIEKLLTEMDGAVNRSARFRTVVALIIQKALYLFEGTVEGTIVTRPAGTGGFGYDPVFVPDGYAQSFAELPPDVKNSISHRAQAIEKMVAFVQKLG
jgi:XTP/dITP diphosphohydrolase